MAAFEAHSTRTGFYIGLHWPIRTTSQCTQDCKRDHSTANGNQVSGLAAKWLTCAIISNELQ